MSAKPTDPHRGCRHFDQLRALIRSSEILDVVRRAPDWDIEDQERLAAYKERARPVLIEHYHEQLEMNDVDPAQVRQQCEEDLTDSLAAVLDPPLEGFTPASTNADVHLACWHLRVVSNKARDDARAVRRRLRRETSFEDGKEEPARLAAAPEHATMDEALLSRRARALQEILADVAKEDPELLGVLRLKYEDDRDWDDIAEIFPSRQAGAWRERVSNFVAGIADGVAGPPAVRTFYRMVFGRSRITEEAARRFLMILEDLREKVELKRDDLRCRAERARLGLLCCPEVRRALAGMWWQDIAVEAWKGAVQEWKGRQDGPEPTLDSWNSRVVHVLEKIVEALATGGEGPWGDPDEVKDRLRRGFGGASGVLDGANPKYN